MQADAEQIANDRLNTEVLAHAAYTAVGTADGGSADEQGTCNIANAGDPILPLVTRAQSLAVQRLVRARVARCPVQVHWTDRPEAWRPFRCWSEASAAWCAARQASAEAFIASRKLTTPFVQSEETEERLRLAFIFSPSIEEAVARAPDLPADLVGACRAEAEARKHLETIRRRAIQTPAEGFDILAKMRLITEQIDNILDPLEQYDVQEAQARPDEFALAHEFFALHDDIVRAVAEPVHNSPAVQALVSELTRRWQTESLPMTEEQLEEACRLTGMIAEEIMALPSTSLETLQAKAQAVLWCHDDRDFFKTCQADAASTADRFMYQIIGDLLDLPASPEGCALSCADPWAERLTERNRLVDYVNETMRSLPDDVDADEHIRPEFERGWALTEEIYDAASSDPKARAAQIRLCLKMDAEGLDMSERSLELLRAIERTLPASSAVEVGA